jgi:putative nucleotide binding protein
MTDEENAVRAVVLDFLARGRSEDERPQYQRSPVAFAVGIPSFRLFEMSLVDDPDVSIGDRIVVSPPSARHEDLQDVNEIGYDDLTGGARSELDYAVAEIVAEDESRFVDFYNDAQPITLRLHQLDLLPGIGDTLRNGILDQRKRGPFEDFDDVERRVDGLHDAEETIVERIREELADGDVKYRAFVERS